MASTVVGTLRVLLEANAAKLESEFEKASLKMGAFDKFTQNAGRNLTRMVEQFSGQKIVTEAAKMAAAVERVGGVSTLTERELRRVSGTVEEATAKLRAMGAEVPPSIAKLNAEITALGTKSVTSTGAVSGLSGALTRLGPLAGALGVSISAYAVINFGKQVLADADAVQKLSDKTGIGVEAIQRLKYAAEQSGNTLDQVTSAVSQMQNRLAEGDKSAVGALRALGLSFEHLRTLAPDQQFMAIAREVALIEDPMERTRVAMDLFGRSGAEILPTLRADMKALGDEAPVMSEKAVKAFDDIGDAISRMWTRSKNAVGEGVSTAIDGYSRLIEASRALMTGQFAQVPEVMLDLATTAPTVAKPLNALAKEAKGVALSMDEMDRISKELTASVGEHLTRGSRDATQAQRELERQTKLTAEAQRKFNEQLRIFGQLSTSLRDAISQGWFGEVEKELQDNFTLIGAVGSEMGKAQQAAEQWAFKNGAVLMPSIKASGVEIEKATTKTVDWSRQLGNLAQAFSQLAQIAGGSLGSVLQSIGQVIGAMNLAHTAGQNIRDGMIEIDEAGGDAAAKFTLMAANIGAYAAAMAQAVNTTNRFQAALGGFSATSSFASGLGWSGGASAAAGLIGGVIGIAFAMEKARAEKARYREALFKVKKEFLDLFNEMGGVRAAFPTLSKEWADLFNVPLNEDVLKRMGDLVAKIQERVGETNDEFADLARQMMDAGFKLPAAFKPVLQQLADLGVLTKDNIALFSQLTDGTVVDWRKMEEAAGRYGDWIKTELGPTFNQLKITDQAKQMVNDFDLMKRGGAEVGSILFGMKEEFIALIQNAIRTGAKLPENMRPWIDQLERTGQLVDENGDKLWDLGALQFAPPIKTEFEILTEALQKFIDKLDLVISKFVDLGNVKLPNLTPDGSAPPGGNTTNPGGGQPIIPMAAGAIVSRPTLALIGERGPEIVAPLSALSRLPDFGFTTPGMPTARFDDVGGDRNQTRPGDVNIWPVLIPSSDNEDVLRDTMSSKLPDDLAADRNSLRTRAIPILAKEVARILRGGR